MTVDLQQHGRTHAPEYPPHGHSDHLPMAMLALEGLGASAQRRQSFADAYLPRLVALPADDPGRRRQHELLRDMHDRGISAVLEALLPRYVSGWYRAAYHPLIRMAYGVTFDVAAEVAAGLSYLERCGPSPRLAELARSARADHRACGLDLFRSRRQPAGTFPSRRRFRGARRCGPEPAADGRAGGRAG